MASGCCSQSFVLPSISVNRNVTDPDGSAVVLSKSVPSRDTPAPAAWCRMCMAQWGRNPLLHRHVIKADGDFLGEVSASLQFVDAIRSRIHAATGASAGGRTARGRGGAAGATTCL